MTKFRNFVLIALFCCSASLFATNTNRDEIMWEQAYKGNFSIVHKLMLTRQSYDINDEIMNQFVMAYVYYRMEQFRNVEAIFEGIDSYLEHKFISKGE